MPSVSPSKTAIAFTRDIVVVGTSLGGAEALGQLVAKLPADFPASLFVVQHSDPRYGSGLPDLLSRRGPLPASHALHGESIRAGHIYVAPPDNHLEMRPGYVSVVRGPKENGHRPAVDALFRTASEAYGPRVIGVVLTGQLDCGTAGLLSIKARGGVAVVQDPADAVAVEMPTSALANVQVDHVVKVRDLGPLLTKLVREQVGLSEAATDAELAAFEESKPGDAAVPVCPLCHGTLTTKALEGFTVFRCHVGHAFTSASLLDEQTQEVERALWAAVRALEEGSTVARRVAEHSHGVLKDRMDERAASQRRQAELIRGLLLQPFDPKG